MPVIADAPLPTYERLRGEGQEILSPERASHQDIREQHIGILNMMQDPVLEATERQFIRLIGNSNLVVQIYIHLFSIPGIERGAEAQKHIETYYKSFDDIRAEGLDGLILTGTNMPATDVTQAPFWKPFCEVIDWAQDNITSVLCSCLATHAVVRHLYNIERQPMEEKLWGVYPHAATTPDHPLMQAVNTRFYVPHSRFNSITRQQFEDAKARTIIESPDAGVHMATSADGFRFVFFQGHPEYDTFSLLKEYKREVTLFTEGQRSDYPPVPQNYLSPQCQAILKEYETALKDAMKTKKSLPEFPEALITARLDNTWQDTSKSIMNNWIGRVYQTTNVDRTKQFMDGIDPDDPLGITKSGSKQQAA